jgi:alanine racemase
MARPNQARLDLAALRHNVGVARALAPQSKVMAVVKANAYGHGAVTIATELDGLVDALAVACIEEAVELRDAGVSAPILLLEGVFEARELATAAQLGFWVSIDNEWQLQWLEDAIVPEPVHCWLKVDTGMHRLGVAANRTEEFFRRIESNANSSGEPVIYTHFASADDVASEQTRQQLQVFDAVCANLPAQRSAANSPGVLAWPEAHYDWIRPGYMLYGNSPMAAPHPNAQALQPVMTLTSAVISLRDVPTGEAVGYAASWTASRPSRIATVTIGYGDGYPRLAPNGTPVLVNGQRAPLAGRVSMDMITVDVTDVPGVRTGCPWQRSPVMSAPSAMS